MSVSSLFNTAGCYTEIQIVRFHIRENRGNVNIGNTINFGPFNSENTVGGQEIIGEPGRETTSEPTPGLEPRGVKKQGVRHKENRRS
ncbi:hypothetical protein GCM10011571_30710 [Marinithermofilum abyssi]|jgi:hypothetical protein|uniref:Uncharacterized protein n=1 Tax=Marinithermofilum abyssi TaxID=1571185 RepID=A0A8J2VIV2_9BACL|nr:hypothetical protein [Marinithermofilum abyssi]GGE26368.1 hypothetical protein GCM10011571_30710 [Marinithermofilum abyssi]